MIEQVVSEINVKMQKAAEALSRDLAGIRTGRASPALVEHIKADYHGVLTPINQLASISIPDAKMILIQPWDSTSIRGIEKAILTSDLGLNPISDSRVLRIPIPPLTEERRKELVKMMHNRLEETRIAIRNVRRDLLKDLREFEHEKLISEDELSDGETELQEMTDKFIEQVDVIGIKKESEIMEV